MKILIIEDDHTLATVLKAAVAKVAQSEIALTLSEGCAALVRTNFDTIILDLSLPDSDANQTLGQIKKLKSMSHCARVLVMTANDDAEFRALAMTCGADSFVPKSDWHLLIKGLTAAVKIKSKPCRYPPNPLIDRIEREAALMLIPARI